jgi:putative heme-binding domain-containing protein
MGTLLRIVCGVALLAPLGAQVQPPPEGHESPADAARRQAGRGGPAAAAPATNPFQSPQDIEQGNGLYQTHCSYCHGAFGEGGRGADLTTGLYRFGGSDAELFNTIRNGIPGSEMGPVRATDDEVWRIVGFVKRLGMATPEKAPGDPVAGKVVYEKTGCASCHIIDGQGGNLGPDLSDIGRHRGLRFLEESLVKPEADLPINYRGIQVVTTSGQTVAGIRLNEDDYSIQLRDTTDNLRSFLKHNLKDIRRDNPSLMPAYGSILSKKQLEDLVAYLSSLKGAQ